MTFKIRPLNLERGFSIFRLSIDREYIQLELCRNRLQLRCLATSGTGDGASFGDGIVGIALIGRNH